MPYVRRGTWLVAGAHEVPITLPSVVRWRSLCLLTVQVLLIRTGRFNIHHKLGIFGAYLIPVMLVLGVMTALAVDHFRLGKSNSDPSFLSIQLGDLISFGLLVSAAIAFRKVPAAHKRLMLISTICISDAGFARWGAMELHNLLGDSV